MIFNLATLPKHNHLSTLLHPSKSYNSNKLNIWWLQLSIEEQSQICNIDSPEIISDLHDTINAALLVSKLQSKTNNQPLVTLKKHKDSQVPKYSYNYRFRLEESKLIDDDLARLLSSYSFMTNTKPQKNGESTQLNELSQAGKGLVCVRKRCVGSFLDMLSNVVGEFGQGQKQTFPKEHTMQFYSHFAQNGPKKAPLEGIESFTIEQLLYKLIAVTLVLENNIYLSYSQKVSQDTLSRLMVTSKAFYTKPTPVHTELDTMNPLLMKSPSPSLSTASTSADSLKDTGVLNLASRNSSMYSTIAKIEKEEALPPVYKNPGLPEGAHNPYDGFHIGDLEIAFEPEDAYFMGKKFKKKTAISEKKKEKGKGYWSVRKAKKVKETKSQGDQENNGMKQGHFSGVLENAPIKIPVM